jgi:diadenosine tetraphosphate (Ap4A) HIT family hydrolase
MDRIWAGWRSSYVASGSGQGSKDPTGVGCVLCGILASGEPDEVTQILWRGEHCAALLNAYPYTSGHLMVLPRRHVGELEDLSAAETAELWETATAGVRALKAAYRPDGINVGLNLGEAAGAGVPGHLHVHVLPRWTADSNFMTTVAEARVLPESLVDTARRLRATWPVPPGPP